MPKGVLSMVGLLRFEFRDFMSDVRQNGIVKQCPFNSLVKGGWRVPSSPTLTGTTISPCSRFMVELISSKDYANGVVKAVAVGAKQGSESDQAMNNGAEGKYQRDDMVQKKYVGVEVDELKH